MVPKNRFTAKASSYADAPPSYDRCAYTYQHYETLLRIALKRGCRFYFFDGAQPKNGSAIFLRHDIDFTLMDAQPIIDIEHRLGIRATYFILLESVTYNPFEREQYQVLRKIVASGHRIGLHIEYDGDFKNRLIRGCNLLERLTGSRIQCFSLHNPTAEAIGRSTHRSFNGYINVYNRKYFDDIRYISDSNQKRSCPCKLMSEMPNGNIQLLIHPMWWQEQPMSIHDIIERHIQNSTSNLVRWYKENNRAFAAWKKNSHIRLH